MNSIENDKTNFKYIFQKKMIKKLGSSLTSLDLNVCNEITFDNSFMNTDCNLKLNVDE